MSNFSGGKDISLEIPSDAVDFAFHLGGRSKGEVRIRILKCPLNCW
jgi:hypothetical protein